MQMCCASTDANLMERHCISRHEVDRYWQLLTCIVGFRDNSLDSQADSKVEAGYSKAHVADEL